MLYSEYSKKVSRLATFLNTLRRFKILILCIVGALLLTAATLIGTRGLVYDSIACPDEIPYGSDFSYRAGAILNDVEYEFCAVGEETWTSERPIRAGRYYVRAVSERTFGAKSYGKVHEFVIVPKNTEINIADSVMFGETPEYSAALVYGDELTVGGFVYADVSKTATLVKADISSVKATDKDGNDVTASYSFISEYGDISFIPREIEITVADATGEYDGTPLTSSAWELTGGTLANGDGIVTVFDKSQTDVGSTENTPKINVSRAVLNSDGIDVTANYKITSKVGKLTVEKREIAVNTLDGTHVYDDTAFSNPEFEIGEGYSLVGDDRLVAAVAQSITDVGTAENKILFEVHNAKGEDVTYNYSIVVMPGTLTVEKREVEMSSASDTKIYDGTPLKNDGYQIVGSLAAGHKFVVTSDTEITNAGSVLNALGGVVYGVDGVTDKSDNYTLVWSYGTLTVSKRNVSVKTNDMAWVYDGESHSAPGFSVTADGGENTGLLSGHTLVSSNCAAVETVLRDALGVPVGTDNFMTFAVKSGEDDMTDNYEISVEFGKLKITPREITVTSATREWMYDDASHADNTVLVTGGELVGGHRLDAYDNVFVKYVAFDDEGNVVGVKNEMTVSVIRIGLSGFENMSNNYDITLDPGTLTVTKRPLALIPYAEAKMYDGDDYDKTKLGVIYGGNAEGGEIIGGIVPGHEAECGFKDFTAIDAGEYDIQVDIDTVTVYDSTDRENANVVTANYDIVCDIRKLEITPRTVYIETESAEFEYDGRSHEFNGFDIVASPTGAVFRPVKDHKLEALTAPAFTDVKRDENRKVVSYDNTVSVRVVGTKQENYDLHVKYGKITVKPIAITVTTNSKTWTYDGTYKSEWGFEITEGAVLTGHNARVTESNNVGIRNVGKTENLLTVRIYGKSSANVTNNYEITYVYGFYTVTPRVVDIVTDSETWVYDGKTHSFAEYTVDTSDGKNDFVLGHKLSVKKSAEITDVARNNGLVAGIDNEFIQFDIVDADGENYDDDANYIHGYYKDNYAVKFTPGTLTVTPRPISVSIKDTTKVFNGLEQYPDYTVDNIVNGHDGYAEFDTSGKYVGEYTVSLSDFDIISGTVDKTDNYDITIPTTPAKLTITKRPIQISSYGTEDDDRYWQAIDYNENEYWYYDGTAKAFEESGWLAVADSDGNLDPDQGLCFYNRVPLHAIVDENFATITDVGSKPNTFTVRLFEYKDPLNGDFTLDKEITENYEITYKYGTIFVMPRPIKLVAESAQKVYDGKPLVCHEYIDEITGKREDGIAVYPKGLGVAKGQTLELTFSADSTITDVGSVPNVIVSSGVKITDADGKDVTGNYKITTESGTLTVTARDLTVVTPDNVKTYDEKPLYTVGEHVADNGIDTGLVVGHTLYYGERNSISCVPESGAKAWVDINRITDENGRDVTRNYNIICEFGTLTVNPRPITVKTASKTWEYDGNQKHVYDYEISDGTLCYGHYTRMLTYYPFILDVGENDNMLDIVIFTDGNNHYDEHGHSYTDNYAITYIYGKVEVTPRKITIDTATDEWDYDGVTHFNTDYKIISGSFVEGQRVEIENYATLKDPGTVDNFLQFAIYTDYAHIESISHYERNVAYNYEITQNMGTLTVKGSDEPDPPEPDDPVLIIKVKSDIAGTLYLRTFGYGEYDGTTDWTASPAYTGQSINYNGEYYSVNFLASLALGNSGAKEYTTEIEIAHPQFMTAVPYFTTLSAAPVYDGDIGFSGTESKYTVSQYYYDYTSDNGAALRAGGLGIYAAVERAYREYVYDTYLSVPSATAEYMNGVISARKFVKSDPEIVSKVAKFVSTAAKYDLEYDTALDSSGDVAVEFLKTYKAGVCRHYATSATMLFRTLGIPARYAVGALCKVEKAGEWTDVMSDGAHAWVEVYIDGCGWVNVEVTGGGFGGGGNGGGTGEPEPKKEKLAIKPVGVEEQYTGREIFAEQKVEDGNNGDASISELEGRGYTYTVTVAGSRTEIGVSQSTITAFALFDADGNDVTDKYDIIFEPGIIRVTRMQIHIFMPTSSKIYDGTPLKFEELFEGEYGYYWLELPQGVGDVRIDMELYGGITDVGSVDGIELAAEFERLGAFTVLDESGKEVTNNYTVVFDSGGLTVEKRDIRVTAGSSEKVYDGTPLTCDEFAVTRGTLCDGHTLTVETSGSITDVGTADNMITKIEITDRDGRDVTDNYNILYVAGNLTVV